MSPASFDNIISKFKTTTKQAADQMQRAAKIAKLKMDVMTLTGEKSRYFQTIGEKTFSLFTDRANPDSQALRELVQHEFSQIERLEKRMLEIDNQIADLQVTEPNGDIIDASEVHVTGDKPSTES